MKEIVIKHKNMDRMALVDDEDYVLISSFNWGLEKDGYAKRKVRVGESIKTKNVFMHRQILKLDDPKLLVDHINGNRLDNRKENLRICTNKENSRNRKPRTNSTSKYIGVSWNTKKKKFYCSIKVGTKSYHLGCYKDEYEASLRYDAAARILHGNFASINHSNITSYEFDIKPRLTMAITQEFGQ